jgi:hypothetical protein
LTTRLFFDIIRIGGDMPYKDPMSPAARASQRRRSATYYKNHKETVVKRSRAWREENPEYMPAQRRAYRKIHHAESAANSLVWREENPDRVRANRKAWNLSHPEYNIWSQMLERCYNHDCNSYKYYGAKGVTVCRRWAGKDGYKNFLLDMGKRPSNKHSLSRLGDTGNYTPRNVVWGTREHQEEQKRVKRYKENTWQPQQFA